MVEGEARRLLEAIRASSDGTLEAITEEFGKPPPTALLNELLEADLIRRDEVRAGRHLAGWVCMVTLDGIDALDGPPKP